MNTINNDNEMLSMQHIRPELLPHGNEANYTIPHAQIMKHATWFDSWVAVYTDTTYIGDQ